MKTKLTRQERQILTLVALPDKSISTIMRLSEHTVKGYWKSIFSKLDVHSRAQAAIMLVLRPGCPKAIRFE